MKKTTEFATGIECFRQLYGDSEWARHIQQKLEGSFAQNSLERALDVFIEDVVETVEARIMDRKPSVEGKFFLLVGWNATPPKFHWISPDVIWEKRGLLKLFAEAIGDVCHDSLTGVEAMAGANDFVAGFRDGILEFSDFEFEETKGCGRMYKIRE